MTNGAFKVMIFLLMPVIIMAFVFLGNEILGGISDVFNPAEEMKYTYSDGVIWVQDKKDYVLCDADLNIIFKLSDKHEGFVPESNYYNGVAVIHNHDKGQIGTIDKTGESVWFDNSYKESYPEITNWEREDADPNNFYGHAWMTGYNEINNYIHFVVIGPDGKVWRDLGKDIYTGNGARPEFDNNNNKYGKYGNGIYNTIHGWYNIRTNEFTADKPEAIINGEVMTVDNVYFSIAEDFKGTLFKTSFSGDSAGTRVCNFYSMNYPKLRAYIPNITNTMQYSPNNKRFPFSEEYIYSRFPTNTKFQKYGFVDNKGNVILDLSQYNLLYAPKVVNDRALLHVIGIDNVINFLIIDIHGEVIYTDKTDITATKKSENGAYEQTELSSVPSNKLFSYQFSNGNILFNGKVHDGDGKILYEFPNLGNRFTYITEFNSNTAQVEVIKASFGRDKRDTFYYIDINTGAKVKPH